MEGMMKGAKLIVLDPRLSNTASMADEWLPTYPGSESAVFMAIANILLKKELYDKDFLKIGLIGRIILKTCTQMTQ